MSLYGLPKSTFSCPRRSKPLHLYTELSKTLVMHSPSPQLCGWCWTTRRRGPRQILKWVLFSLSSSLQKGPDVFAHTPFSPTASPMFSAVPTLTHEQLAEMASKHDRLVSVSNDQKWKLNAMNNDIPSIKHKNKAPYGTFKENEKRMRSLQSELPEIKQLLEELQAAPASEKSKRRVGNSCLS